MEINITTQQFSQLNLRETKKVFEQFLGHKVNQIVSGSMTNQKWGEFRVRHEECAYSKIKVEPSENGLTKLSIYNYNTRTWDEAA